MRLTLMVNATQNCLAKVIRQQAAETTTRSFATSHPTPPMPPMPAMPALKEHSMLSLFTPSPLASSFSLPREEVDRLVVLYADPDIQRAAGALRLKRARLADLAGFRSNIAEAISISDRTGVAVVEVLRRLGEDADDACDDVRADHAAHDAAKLARQSRLAPLLAAVSTLSTRCAVERDSLLMHLDGCRRGKVGQGDVAAQRYASLVDAGLTHDQMQKIGVFPPEDPAAMAGAYQARLAEVSAIQAQCKAFFDDPHHSPAHLDGLGLEAVIASVYLERVAEVPA